MILNDFRSLFADDPDLQAAAVRWWDAVSEHKDPYCQLWFRHFRCEARDFALRDIRIAFAEAHRTNLLDCASVREWPCDILEVLRGQVRPKGPVRPDVMIPSLPEPARFGDGTGAPVTFIWVEVTQARRARWSEIADSLDRKVHSVQSSGVGILWITPSRDVADCFEDTSAAIDELRDRLGTAHWRTTHVIVRVTWMPAIAKRLRMPAIVDAGWAFFRPVPSGLPSGLTLHLRTGGVGTHEAVVAASDTGPYEEWDAGPGGNRWQVTRQYDEPAATRRYSTLCKSLLVLATDKV